MPCTDLIATERVFPAPTTSDTEGSIRWDPVKSLWLFAMIAGGIAAVTLTPSLGGMLVFLGLTAVTICGGHSVGMHRLLIHRSFRAPKWLEHLLVWLGTLVGMAGPFGMIRAHDMRDWHQRQPTCPPHPSHDAGFWRDAWWQLHCRFDLCHPPHFVIETEAANDTFYRIVERTWMAQQLIVALPLFLIGGIGWVLWGVCLRVAVSLIGPLDRGALCPPHRASGLARRGPSCAGLQPARYRSADIRRKLARQSPRLPAFGKAGRGTGTGRPRILADPHFPMARPRDRGSAPRRPPRTRGPDPRAANHVPFRRSPGIVIPEQGAIP